MTDTPKTTPTDGAQQAIKHLHPQADVYREALSDLAYKGGAGLDEMVIQRLAAADAVALPLPISKDVLTGGLGNIFAEIQALRARQDQAPDAGDAPLAADSAMSSDRVIDHLDRARKALLREMKSNGKFANIWGDGLLENIDGAMAYLLRPDYPKPGPADHIGDAHEMVPSERLAAQAFQADRIAMVKSIRLHGAKEADDHIPEAGKKVPAENASVSFVDGGKMHVLIGEPLKFKDESLLQRYVCSDDFIAAVADAVVKAGGAANPPTEDASNPTQAFEEEVKLFEAFTAFFPNRNRDAGALARAIMSWVDTRVAAAIIDRPTTDG